MLSLSFVASLINLQSEMPFVTKWLLATRQPKLRFLFYHVQYKMESLFSHNWWLLATRQPKGK